MVTKYMKNAVLTALAATVLMGGTIYAAEQNEPSSLDGDEVTYDMKSGLMTATGNVLMTHGTAKVTGAKAEFNTKTKEGKVEGNVIAVQEDMRLTADSCVSDGQDHMLAEGNVHATKADKTYVGPRVDYFQSQDYILMEQGGTVSSTAGDVFTADKMEGWSKTNSAKGTGNAHLVSPANQLEAGGDVVDYYGKVAGSEEPGKAYLTGNAWAVQDNNTLKSNKLTIYLAESGEATAAEE